MKAYFAIFMFTMVIGSTAQAQAQDWANLKRFEAENAVLAAGPAAQGRVVFMGDSITEGWSDLYPEFFEGKPYVNRGISGQTTAQMLIRFRQDVIQLRPSFVVILAGTNDIAENQGPITLDAIVDNIASMAELGYANGLEVIIASVLPAYDYPWRPGLSPNTKIPALNELIRAYADSHGFMYLDYFSRMTDGKNGLQASLATDGVHLSKEGYEVMSELVSAALAATGHK
ncbi:MAG: SGNH/GDSL hydrolase family protein [Bacteroidetes bacterium]|nr:SGNH/GDSL hydrolase family protein [Bacteroidota bacterium]